MEIQFEEQKAFGYFDLARLTKKVQVAMESVVPDTRDDIGRILSARPEIYLKSKECMDGGALVVGEAVVNVLYINETESAVSAVRLTQSFSLNYELPSADDSIELQIRLVPLNVQARAVNPRKLSADLELTGELTVSRRGSTVMSQSLPKDVWAPVHLLNSEIPAALLTSLCEKSFSVNEQLLLPPDAAGIREIVSREYRFQIDDRQNVGSRLLLKGRLYLHMLYTTDDSAWPLPYECAIAFSQLIDLGAEDVESCEVQIIPTSDYLDLIDSMDGQKLLDVDLHALAQVRGSRLCTMKLVTDAYSNSVPCRLDCVDFSALQTLQKKDFSLQASELIELPEEFDEYLASYVSLGQCTSAQGSAVLDLLCRSSDGKLFALRRSLKLSGDGVSEELPVLRCEITTLEVRPDERQLQVLLRAEGTARVEQAAQLKRVNAIELDEEKAFDASCYPSLTAVWGKTESVWELAKCYHSSQEAIRALNDGNDTDLVFIPKTV